MSMVSLNTIAFLGLGGDEHLDHLGCRGQRIIQAAEGPLTICPPLKQAAELHEVSTTDVSSEFA
jgi:hypothetical protein